MNEANNLERLAIDTSEVISGTISPNNYSSQIISSWAEGNFNWIQTQDTFDELKEVLSREKLRVKYHINEEETQNLLDNLSVGAEFVTPLPFAKLPIHCRDLKDDKFLACALGGNCDYLITEDEDLLVLNKSPELKNLQIIQAEEYLKRKK